MSSHLLKTTMVLFAPRTGKIPQLGDTIFIGFTGLHVSIMDRTVTVAWNKTVADFRGELWRNCRLNWKKEKVKRRMASKRNRKGLG